METIYTCDRKEWRAWLSSHFQTSQEIWLVYPLSREMCFFGEISFESVGAAGNTSCAVSVFPVDLTRITASLEELLARIEEQLSRRRAFAHPDYSG